MSSLASPPNNTALAPFPLAAEYPFAPWSDLGDRTGLHPELAAMWSQIVVKLWRRGHPAAGKLLHAIYELSRCRSFAVGGGA